MRTLIVQFLALVSFLLTTHIAQAQLPQKQLKRDEINKLLAKDKLWEMEKLVLDDTSGMTYTFCTNADCSASFVWNFSLKEIDTIRVEKVDEYTALSFICGHGNCIKPLGAGRYEPKGLFQLFITNKAEAKKIMQKLLEFKKLK